MRKTVAALVLGSFISTPYSAQANQEVPGGKICFPSGECVDPGDVGSICCPFKLPEWIKQQWTKPEGGENQ